MSHTVLETQLPGSVIRALLRTQGYLALASLFSSAYCSQLCEEVRRAAVVGPCINGHGPATRVIALLAHSDLALQLLDHNELGKLIDEGLGNDVILSRAEGTIPSSNGAPLWQSDFEKPRRNLPARSFRPGIAFWTPLNDSGEIEVLRTSQHVRPAESPHITPATRLVIPQGGGVLLEGGTSYRFTTSETVWLSLAFVRPWIKPEVLFFAALGDERINRLNERGRRWCGVHLGLPTSVEEFLAIEQAALDTDLGRAKGSGI
ncbi:MAG TPA: hypothetical protein VF088_00740 [Pyrinomonadaceae bacterium]